MGKFSLTILMMDLDRFKYVNDSLGHGVGDHVLREVSRRLQRVVDAAECIARLGGDEFAILRAATRGYTDSADTARRIVDALEAPILYEGQPLDVGASIGIAHFPDHGRTRRRWCATRTSRCTPPNATRPASRSTNPTTTRAQQEHLSLLSELRRAVDRNELRLVLPAKGLAAFRATSAPSRR